MPDEATPQATDPIRIHAMPVETVPIDSVQPMPGNPRIGNRPMIVSSLEEHGLYKPVIVQTSTGHVIAGNNTWHALKERDSNEIAVQWLDVDDTRARKINAIDNRASDKATYDDRLLLEFLEELPDLDGTGYDPGDIESLEHLLDDDSWRDTGDDPSGSGSAEPDPGAFWPEIKVKVPPEVFDAWHELLSTYEGRDDAEKIKAHLRASGHLA